MVTQTSILSCLDNKIIGTKLVSSRVYTADSQTKILFEKMREKFLIFKNNRIYACGNFCQSRLSADVRIRFTFIVFVVV